jgi:hypothetical protein
LTLYLNIFKGCSGYYSGTLSKVEIEIIDSYLRGRGISTQNTRLIKVSENHYQVLVASINTDFKTYYSN